MTSPESGYRPTAEDLAEHIDPETGISKDTEFIQRLAGLDNQAVAEYEAYCKGELDKVSDAQKREISRDMADGLTKDEIIQSWSRYIQAVKTNPISQVAFAGMMAEDILGKTGTEEWQSLQLHIMRTLADMGRENNWKM
jgi:hypothetical protein